MDILFAVAIVKGGSTVRKEMAEYNRLYGRWLYCCIFVMILSLKLQFTFRVVK